jgi:tetratricopeptide (TPR) repeat protein
VGFPRRAHLFVPGGLVLAAWLACPAAQADTITLKNGHVIQAERTWFEGNQLLYEKNGGVFGLPRSLVEKLEQKSPPEPADDADVLKARERLAAHDPVAATHLLRIALSRDPRSLPALHAITEAYLSLGDARSARDFAERAARVDDRNARSRALLGDALAALGDRSGAEAEYRKSVQLKPDAEIRKRLEEVAPPPPTPVTRGPEFRIRYDGGVNEPLGLIVLQALTEAYNEYARRLGFNPEDPVTVVLQTGTGFQDTGVPGWAEGLNDGTIRVPVQGLSAPTPRVVRVLRHELAHSFIAGRTGGNCPTWLQEGISQWLEGGDPAREDANLAPLARAGHLRSLVTLEGPFQSLSEADAPLAYAESLSAVAHIVRTRGEVGVVRLLSALGDRLPSEEALPVALALSYPEFEQGWEAYLRTADTKK